jgi:hypothetical protein
VGRKNKKGEWSCVVVVVVVMVGGDERAVVQVTCVTSSLGLENVM